MSERTSSFSVKSFLGADRFATPLFRQALTHPSSGSFNNQRLEFLGDSLIGMLIAESLYMKFPEADEGELSVSRSRLVRSESLAQIARENGLEEMMIVGKSLAAVKNFPDSALEDALEALIAACYMDMGLDVTREFARKLFASRLRSLELAMPAKPNKSQLQEFLQALALDLPVYIQLSAPSDNDSGLFHVECSAFDVEGERLSASGTGRKKVFAEDDAASKVLRLLMKPAE